ncbi:Metallophosphoesterase domain-containing protein [Cynara cardunculus var. scolymus]|uniref:Metallophosphoesterase domain-containing protein n=1 Tax=Cynara cardunculus var. scolymus TaxID=59895 RepID=A0A118JX53_CYNCS|nr:Metallophosphoesterase domain-containing protein [Cynara cardunculus var. scolymus]
MQSTKSWIYALFYLTLITILLYLMQVWILSDKLMVSHHRITSKKHPNLPLRFNFDGTFKILQVADMHYGTGLTRCRDVLSSEFQWCSDLNTTLFLKRMIDAEKPDFIAFTGDNIFGSSTDDAAESLFKAFGPAMDSRLPWAAVLGNHDQESTMTREELMSFISLMDYSLSQPNPSTEDTSDPAKQQVITDIDGFGNYDLRVWGAPGSYLANQTILNLFFLDSGDRAVVNGGHKQENHQSEDIPMVPTPPPALAFFHIPIPEIRYGPFMEIFGEYHENVACSVVNSGVLQTFVSMGDVKAVFIGHDHLNDFCGNLDGIWFCYGGGFGYHGYGKAGLSRRARVILAELKKGKNEWMGVETIKTWKRIDDKKLTKIDEQILWTSS